MAPDDLPAWRGYAFLALGSVGYAAFTFVWFTFPAFLTPIVAELGLSPTLAGVVNGAIPLTYIPVALFSGLVIDRIGPGRAIGVGLLVLGAAQALRATAGDFAGLLAFTVAIGVGGTGITFGLPKLVAEVVPTDRRGTGTSVYIVGASAGTAAAFSLGRPVLGPALGGWRPVFHWSGLAVVALAVGWLALAATAPDGADGSEATDVGVREDLRTVLGNRGLRLLVVVGVVYLLVMHGTQAWIATVLEHRGLAPGLAAGLTTLLVVARTGGVLAIPPLSDVIGARREVLSASGLFAAVGVAMLVLPDAGAWLAAAGVILAGLGLGGISPLLRTLPIELPEIGPRLTGTATGMIFAVGEVGGFLGPFLVGSLYDLTGTYAVGLGLLAAASLVVVLAGARLPETGPGTSQASTPE